MNWRKATKRTIIVALVVVVVAGGIGGWFWWKKRNSTTETTTEAPTTAEVTRGPLRQTVDCTGKVVSNLDVEIKCRASGEVKTLPFEISNTVKKDDLLLELDPADQQRMLQQAEAALAASKARLAQAQATLAVAEKTLEADRLKSAAALHSAEARATDAGSKAKRERQLLDKKYSSLELSETAATTALQADQDLKTAQAQTESLKAQELDLETKRQQINLNRAQVDSDTIALSLAQRQLDYTKVFAPRDAVVSLRPVQIGQIISSGISNVGGGTTVMTLSDLSRIYLLASVDEINIGFIQLGQSVRITADSYPAKRFRGTVDRIAPTGVNVSNVVTFEVRIEVESEDKTLLKPMMTTNVSIVIADKADVLMVPVGAIVRAKGETFVALKSDEEAGQRQAVEVGITDGRNTEIVSGVKEGDVVLLQKSAGDSRWQAGSDPARDAARQRMMMMRTMGGGGGGGGGRGR